MRRSDKEISDKRIIEEVFEKSEICRLGIADEGVPYIVPLNYGYSDGKLYFHTARQGRKIELLCKNNRVAFEIEYLNEIVKGDMPCNWTARYRSLMGTGNVEIIEDENQIRDGLNIIMSHYGSTENTYNEANLKRIFILKLTIESVTGKQSGFETSDEDSLLVIDVRSAREFSSGAYPGAINIPLNELAGRTSELGENRKREIIVYCASGSRSSYAKKMLNDLGFENVKNGGGIGQMMQRR